MGPGALDQVLCGLPVKRDPRLLFSQETSEDAGVYKLTEDLALIQTVDFFTPVVNDPYYFGQIAAANSLSDVYAMGGRPITALNLICFPSQSLDIEILKEIIRGGLEKINESGAILVGGHSVEDQELKYGLSVTGIVHPNNLWSNAGALPGDKIILTKPIGTGILNTAIKGDAATLDEIDTAIGIMSHLNQTSSEIMLDIGGIHACTDVTGFGLIGHLYNICKYSKVTVGLESQQIPIIDAAIKYSQMGMIPGALHNNRKFFQPCVEVRADIYDYLLDFYFDPQTSGGLLACVDESKCNSLLDRLLSGGETWTRVIGAVLGKGDKIIIE